MSAVGRAVRDYRDTWERSGTGGRAVLLGGFTFVVRVVGFSFLFPLYVKASGFSTEQYGILFALINIVPIVALLPILWLARRGWDRRLMMIGPAFGLTGLLILIVGRELPFGVWMVATVVSGGSSATYWTLSDPLLAEATPHGIRPRVYALKWLFFTLGSSLGALLAGVVPDLLRTLGDVNERNSYWAMLFVLGGLDVAQIRLFSRAPVRAMVRAPRLPRAERRASFRAIGTTLALFGIAEATSGIGYNTIRPYISLFLTDGQGLSSGQAGLVIGSTAIFAAAGALTMPLLAVKIGNTRAMAILRFGGAMSVAGWFFVGDVAMVIALTFLYYGLIDGTSALYAAEVMGRLPASARDLMAGLNNVMWSVVAAGSVALSGFLQDRPGGGFGLAFSVAVAGYVASALWCGLVLPRVKSPGDVPAGGPSTAVEVRIDAG